jgi:hypothetical protein
MPRHTPHTDSTAERPPVRAVRAPINLWLLHVGISPDRPQEGRPSAVAYWRAMAMRISASVLVMRSPDRSMVTLCSVPVNLNGGW